MYELTIPGLAELVTLYPVEENFDQMVDVVRICAAIDGINPIVLQHDAIPMAETYIKAKDIQSAFVVKVGPEIIGYVCLRWWQERDALKSYAHNGRIVSAWRGRGIGTALVAWAEARIQELAMQDIGITQWVIRAHAAETEVAASQLLLDMDYTVNTDIITLSITNLVAPPLIVPVGCTIRPIEPGDYRAVWAANEEAFAGEEGRNVPTEEDYIDFTHWLSSGNTTGIAAWYSGEVAGVALLKVDFDTAEIAELSVREKFRRRGIGRALVAHALHLLTSHGIRTVCVSTTTDNQFGSVNLYQSTGFHIQRVYHLYSKLLSEVS